jgi:hypothetical protein
MLNMTDQQLYVLYRQYGLNKKVAPIDEAPLSRGGNMGRGQTTQDILNSPKYR